MNEFLRRLLAALALRGDGAASAAFVAPSLGRGLLRYAASIWVPLRAVRFSAVLTERAVDALSRRAGS
jgi:hypothetical protein